MRSLLLQALTRQFRQRNDFVRATATEGLGTGGLGHVARTKQNAVYTQLS